MFTLSLYSIRIASLQGNHGYFLYVVVNKNKKNKKQDKMKLENIYRVESLLISYESLSMFTYYFNDFIYILICQPVCQPVDWSMLTGLTDMQFYITQHPF